MAIATTGTAMAILGREALPPSVWNWSRGYIGGHVGGRYGRTSFTNPFGPSIYGDVVDIPSFVAGGQIGYNWQNNSWVFGGQGERNSTREPELVSGDKSSIR
ncbi:hypothetical protein [Bradyrhizobium arachidis]|uniref:hypothetical protein n=1 Tax=Bradyrhizobium arachidis TaxID=858423 RepID=UPI002163D42D|nr:hypothetical protein [Bradyrhizobium arachidis]